MTNEYGPRVLKDVVVSAEALSLLRRGRFVVFRSEQLRGVAWIAINGADVEFTVYNNATDEPEYGFPVSLDDLRALLEIADLSK